MRAGMVARTPGEHLLGRTHERELLVRLLEDAVGGHSGVLVLHGEPGVGKTALLEYAVEAARAFRVVRTAGVEGEIELPYAALHQLCSRDLELIERLPAPQKSALGVAFGLSAGKAPEPFLVGLAVLGLLSEAAQERQLLCVVDDAQWLDRESARALSFVARRLLAEKIALVFSARQIGDLLAGLPELLVGPLGHRDSRILLESALPGRLDEAVRERILRETHGNPLGILELPRGLTPAQLAGGFGLPSAQPLSARIEDSFTRRLATLPRDARQLLLLAAADPVGDPALVWRAAQSLGIPESTARRVDTEGLVAFGPEVVFRHPLVRSAIYGASGPEERSEVHAALADATDSAIDPDRRAWHRAQAAAMPDEDVAADLERSADRAQARGGVAAAAAFLERASALTPAEWRRSGRALRAAQAKLQAGALDDALRLVATAETGMLNPFEQARATLLRGQVSFLMTRSSEATTLLLRAADQLREFDSDLARETYLEALTAAIFAGQLAGPGASSRDIAQAARAAPMSRQPRVPDLLLDGFVALLTDAYGAAVPILRQAQRAIGGVKWKTEQLRWMWGATVSTLLLWDDGGWERLSDLHLALVRETGALSELVIALSHRSQLHVFAGELAPAASVHDALQEATDLTGSPIGPYHTASAMAMRGREAEAVQFISGARADVIRRGEGAGLAFMDWAESLLYNGLGRYAEALAAARRVFDHSELVELNWAMPELIEAAVRVGALDLATDVDRRLSDRCRTSGTDWALGIAARSHALVVTDATADDLYSEAIERLTRTRVAVDLARSRLLYGEWLRREQRQREAREHLRAAHALFLEFGMEAFAHRAATELHATGEKVRKRTVETRYDLTPQEQRVSELVAEGASNKEIAAQLYISPATVEYHLGKVFRKLGVTSRSQLVRHLLQSGERLASTPGGPRQR